MKILLLPDLGEGLAEAEIRQWYVHENEVVVIDQPLVSVETAKAIVDIPSPYTGKVLKLYGKTGDAIATGTPLISFVVAEEESNIQNTVVGHLPSQQRIIKADETIISSPTIREEGVKILPALRAYAKQQGVNLTSVVPTGPNNRMTIEDIDAAAASRKISGNVETAPEGYEILKGVRRAMALSMIKSHQEVVPVSLNEDVDIYRWPTTSDITVRVIQAMIAACAEEPGLNAWFDGATLSRKLNKEIHLGLAMDAPEGLFVPVLHNIALKTSLQLREIIDQYKLQVRDRTIAAENLRGPTIVLTNVGIWGGRYSNPIVIPPMVAILAIGKIRNTVVLTEHGPETHRVLPVSVTVDHRAVTGGEIARFLKKLIEKLEIA